MKVLKSSIVLLMFAALPALAQTSAVTAQLSLDHSVNSSKAKDVYDRLTGDENRIAPHTYRKSGKNYACTRTEEIARGRGTMHSYECTVNVTFHADGFAEIR